MMRTLCVATVVMGLAVGLAVPATAAPPPPNPAPYNPVFSPGQVPALRPSRGTQLPVLMSGPSRAPEFLPELTERRRRAVSRWVPEPGMGSWKAPPESRPRNRCCQLH